MKGGSVAAPASGAAASDSVMVAVRCRPMNGRERDQQEANILTINPEGYASIKQPDGSARQFSFDYTYDENSYQRTVYENLGAPLLDKAFNGWNGTIFAYGQTGAGKSFSMTGTAEMPGIIPQMNVEMFARIGDTRAANAGKEERT